MQDHSKLYERIENILDVQQGQSQFESSKTIYKITYGLRHITFLNRSLKKNGTNTLLLEKTDKSVLSMVKFVCHMQDYDYISITQPLTKNQLKEHI